MLIISLEVSQAICPTMIYGTTFCKKQWNTNDDSKIAKKGDSFPKQNSRKNKQTNKRTNKQTNKQTNRQKNTQTKGGRKTQPAPHNQKTPHKQVSALNTSTDFISIFRTTKLPPYNLTSTDRSGVASARPEKNCKKLWGLFFTTMPTHSPPPLLIHNKLSSHPHSLIRFHAI